MMFTLAGQSSASVSPAYLNNGGLTSGAVASNQGTVTYPTLTSGNLLIFVSYTYGSTSVSPPADFTEIAEYNDGSNSYEIAYRITDGSEATTYNTGAGTFYYNTVYQFENVNSSTPYQTYSHNGPTSTTTLSITPSKNYDGSLVVAFFIQGDNLALTNSYTGWTQNHTESTTTGTDSYFEQYSYNTTSGTGTASSISNSCSGAYMIWFSMELIAE